MIKIKFHKSIRKFTNVESHTFTIDSLSDVKDALMVLFPKLKRYIYSIMNGNLKENICLIDSKNKIVTRQQYEINKFTDDTYTLVPIIGGAGGKTGAFIAIAIGIALVATAVVLSGGTAAGLAAPALGGFGGFTVGGILKIGVGLALSGLMQALMQPPKQNNTPTNDANRRNGDRFDSFQNNIDSNASVPLLYGMPRVSGQILSGHLETITHGQNKNVRVIDLFYQDSDEITSTG